MKIANLINILYKYATVYSYLAYHGTNAENVPSILANGLKKHTPSGELKSSVYLTPNISQAAWYAFEGAGKKQAAVLEIYLSGKHRIKKIQRDLLDREEDYDNDPYYDLTRYIINDVARILNIKDNELRDLENIIQDDPDLNSLRGFNIYRYILNKAEELKLNKNEVKKEMFKIMPEGKTYNDILEITGNGTFSFTETFYKSMHQQTYPKDIPPSTIKYIWLSDVPENVGIETKVIKTKMLPYAIEQLNSKFYILNDYKYSHSLYDLEDAAKFLSNVDVFKNDANKLIEAISNKDKEKIEECIENLFDELDFQNDRGDFYSTKLSLTKFTPQQALQYIKK